MIGLYKSLELVDGEITVIRAPHYTGIVAIAVSANI